MKKNTVAGNQFTSKRLYKFRTTVFLYPKFFLIQEFACEYLFSVPLEMEGRLKLRLHSL